MCGGLSSRIILTLGLLLSLSAVAQAQDKGLKKFHWGVTSLSASQWIPWIAKEAKLYEKYGMEAELVLLRGSGQSAQAIIGGSGRSAGTDVNADWNPQFLSLGVKRIEIRMIEIASR